MGNDGHRTYADDTRRGGGSGGGGITRVQSPDSSITVANPNGPIVDITIPGLSGLAPGALTSGQFAWIPAAGFTLPTDNLDARAANVIACYTGGAFRTSGLVTDAQFTTVGGKPANGAPVYLAAATDDAATAAGKLTATRPRAGMPYPVYPQRFVQNAVRVGIVTDNANYDATKRCRVLLQLPTATAIDPPAPDEFWVGQEVNGLSNIHFLGAAANDPQFTMAAGHTLVLLFSNEVGTFTGLDDLISFDDAATGNQWQLCGDAGGAIRMQWLAGFALVGQIAMVNVPPGGLNCIVVTAAANPDGVLAINGERVAKGGLTAPAGGPSVASVIRLGGGLPGFAGWTAGGVYAVAMLNRAMSEGEAIAVSAMVQPPTIRNRYVLPRAVMNDPTLQWSFNAADWVGATPPTAIGGPQGTGFTFTDHATTRVQRTQQWYRSLAPLFSETEPVAVDSRNLARTTAGARLVFTVPTVADLFDMALTVTDDDFDNADNGGITWIVNGLVQPSFPTEQQADGLPHLYWLRTLLTGPLGVAPYTVEFIVPDKILRELTFQSGACIVDMLALPDAPFAGHGAGANRLIIVGDDEAIGHDTSAGIAPFQNSLTTLLRSDYPGRVTCFATSTGGIANATAWGGGTIVPFARQLFTTAQEGTPAARTYYFQFGFNDYFFANLTLAQFAADYGQLLNAIHALDPTATYYVQRFIQSTYDATPNANGDTGAQFNTAISALTTGRPWLAIANARVPNVITFVAAGRRPSQTGGTAAWKANVKAILGY